MSIVITDKAILEQLTQASGILEVRDTDGNLLGTFAPPYGRLPPAVRSPFSDDEVERRRKETDGRPLAEIIADLERHA
jgi:hypothetical protein